MLNKCPQVFVYETRRGFVIARCNLGAVKFIPGKRDVRVSRLEHVVLDVCELGPNTVTFYEVCQ